MTKENRKVIKECTLRQQSFSVEQLITNPHLSPRRKTFYEYNKKKCHKIRE